MFTAYTKPTAYAGSLSGSMNMMGNLGGVLAPIFVAQILKMSGNNWTLTFWVSAALYLIGAACWYFIDPVTPLDQESRHSARHDGATSGDT